MTHKNWFFRRIIFVYTNCLSYEKLELRWSHSGTLCRPSSTRTLSQILRNRPFSIEFCNVPSAFSHIFSKNELVTGKIKGVTVRWRRDRKQNLYFRRRKIKSDCLILIFRGKFSFFLSKYWNFADARHYILVVFRKFSTVFERTKIWKMPMSPRHQYHAVIIFETKLNFDPNDVSREMI